MAKPSSTKTEMQERKPVTLETLPQSRSHKLVQVRVEVIVDRIIWAIAAVIVALGIG